MTLRNYAVRRWRIFASTTTFHGVKEISLAPVPALKLLWVLILMSCAFIMSAQIVTLTRHYLSEPTTTMVVSKNESYPLPLLLMIVRTGSLVPPSANADDPELYTYARSLVDKRVPVDSGYNASRARRKMDQFLRANPNSSWFDVLKPHMVDLRPWIETSGGAQRLKVVRQVTWNVATYFFLEPANGAEVTSTKQDMVLEGYFNWMKLPGMHNPRRQSNFPEAFMLTSYGLMADMVEVHPGKVVRVRFDIKSNRRSPLRRRNCRKDSISYFMYDEERCNETCAIKAEILWSPRNCYDYRYSWLFYEMAYRVRPCSYGVSYRGRHYLNSEVSVVLPGGDERKMREEHGRCYQENCESTCEELIVRTSSDSRTITDLDNRSMVYLSWPATNAIPVYQETLQYTWDGFVGQLGGLVGLWMGASVMSVVEAVYLCCCCCYDVKSERRPSASDVKVRVNSAGREPPDTDADRDERPNRRGLCCGRGRRHRRRQDQCYKNDTNGNLYNMYHNTEELSKFKPTTWVLDETLEASAFV